MLELLTSGLINFVSASTFENPQKKFSLFWNAHKENMFTIEKEDGGKAPLKPSIYIIHESNRNC